MLRCSETGRRYSRCALQRPCVQVLDGMSVQTEHRVSGHRGHDSGAASGTKLVVKVLAGEFVGGKVVLGTLDDLEPIPRRGEEPEVALPGADAAVAFFHGFDFWMINLVDECTTVAVAPVGFG